MIVILRHIKTRSGVKLDGRIVENRGRRNVAAFHHHPIKEGLQRRSGLAIGISPIDCRRGRISADPADIGQHVSAFIVDHHHCAVARARGPQS